MWLVPALRFPEFSGEWNTSSIEEQFELYSGNTPSRMDKKQFDGTVNWITSGELKEHYIADTKEKISDEAVKSNNLKLLPVGTFVIAIYGLEADGVRGTCSITASESTISQACMAFISKKDIANEFLYAWYKKHGNVIGIRYAQGTKQQNLSYDIIEKFNISYPCIEEQKKLIRFISLIDERIATQNKIIEDLKKLKSAIYQEMFGSLVAQTLKLGQVAEVVKGKQVNGTELLEQGDYYVMNGGTLPSGWLYKYNTEANTISISEGGNSCGYVQYNTSPYWSGGHCYSLKILHPQETSDLYLYHFLKWQEENIMALRIGSGLPNIQKKDLLHFPVILPTITQQNKIVLILSAIEEKVSCEISITQYFVKQKEYLLSQLFI